MIKRIAFLFVLAVSCYAVDSSRDKQAAQQPLITELPTIIMDADFATWIESSDKNNVEYKFVVTLTNVSKGDITVPSRSFDGGPCCWLSSIDGRGVSYVVGQHWIGSHLIVPSPLTFLPVLLHPGESTEFARYNVKVDAKTPLKWFSADITVDEEYGKKQGWWTGTTQVRIDLKSKKQIDPFF